VDGCDRPVMCGGFLETEIEGGTARRGPVDSDHHVTGERPGPSAMSAADHDHRDGGVGGHLVSGLPPPSGRHRARCAHDDEFGGPGLGQDQIGWTGGRDPHRHPVPAQAGSKIRDRTRQRGIVQLQQL
jgi:hypothetical protein